MTGGFKLCSQCQTVKTVEEFRRRKTGKDGRTAVCAECKREQARTIYKLNPAQSKRYRDTWVKKNPQIAAQHRRKSRQKLYYQRYNMTAVDYATKLAEQKGLCAICNRPETRRTSTGSSFALCVDHNHKTGRVRDLLCHSCNVFLGHISDNPDIALKIIDYLHKWR